MRQLCLLLLLLSISTTRVSADLIDLPDAPGMKVGRCFNLGFTSYIVGRLGKGIYEITLGRDHVDCGNYMGGDYAMRSSCAKHQASHAILILTNDRFQSTGYVGATVWVKLPAKGKKQETKQVELDNGFTQSVSVFRESSDCAKENAKLVSSKPKTPTMAHVHLNITPQSSKTSVTVNREPVDLSNPTVDVMVDSSNTLTVQDPSFPPMKRLFMVTAEDLGNKTDWTLNVSLEEKLRFGYLSVPSSGWDATILMEGQERAISSLPAGKSSDYKKLPIGAYTLHLVEQKKSKRFLHHHKVDAHYVCNIDVSITDEDVTFGLKSVPFQQKGCSLVEYESVSAPVVQPEPSSQSAIVPSAQPAPTNVPVNSPGDVATASHSTPAYRAAHVSGETVELKTSADSSASTKGTLSKGTPVNASAQSKNGYYLVRSATAFGWIRQDELDFTAGQRLPAGVARSPVPEIERVPASTQ